MTVYTGRLAGAILVECGGSYFLVGNTKEPCDWEKSGFRAPAEIDAKMTPVLPLETISTEIQLGLPRLKMELNEGQTGEEAAHVLANRFLIVRNASVSDRLWNVVAGESGGDEIEATWLLNMPEHVWQIVRDTVLKCL